jgi:catechol 2,3-dioxygenase-like lactoylglutathione lyase family enzyme
MASPKKLAHVVFRTGNLPAMRDWYCTVLEARVAFSNDFVAFITYDDEHHRVAFANLGATDQPTATTRGLEHVAFTYAGLGDLLDTYERLKGIDIVPYWTINHGPTTSLYYRDPDGNQVELQIDNCTLAEADAFVRSEAFQKNPIGVPFDADTLLARFRSGEPVAELVRYPA